MITIEKNELNIYDVESLYSDCSKELAGGSFEIDLSKVTKIDISIIQLLISTHKSAIKDSKSFKIIGVGEQLNSIFTSSACEFLIGGADE